MDVIVIKWVLRNRMSVLVWTRVVLFAIYCGSESVCMNIITTSVRIVYDICEFALWRDVIWRDMMWCDEFSSVVLCLKFVIGVLQLCISIHFCALPLCTISVLTQCVNHESACMRACARVCSVTCRISSHLSICWSNRLLVNRIINTLNITLNKKK